MTDKIKLVSIYDPVKNVFREVPVQNALKFIKVAKELEIRLKKEKENEQK